MTEHPLISVSVIHAAKKHTSETTTIEITSQTARMNSARLIRSTVSIAIPDNVENMTDTLAAVLIVTAVTEIGTSSIGLVAAQKELSITLMVVMVNLRGIAVIEAAVVIAAVKAARSTSTTM